MKKIRTTIVLALLSITAFAQVPAWQWANSAGGNVSDESVSIAKDASGNVFICGKFYSPSITFGTFTLTNLDNSGTTADVFLVKYNSAGSVLWAKSAGGTQDDIANSVATDTSGNVFISGYFQSSSIVFGITTLTNASTTFDLFLVKYDGSGTVLWAKREGGTGNEVVNSVATDATGNAYITGYFSSLLFSIGTTTLSNSGSEDVFVAKYDVSGIAIWAKSASGFSLDMANSVTIDVSGNVYISGYFMSATLTFGTTTLTNGGNNTTDIFTAKYSSGGTFAWAKRAGGTFNDIAYSVVTDVSGNVFIAGYFQSNSLVFGSATLTNAGGSDILLLKYSSSGTPLTAIGQGGTGYEGANSVSLDASGNIYLAGYHSANFVVGSTTLTGAGGNDGFLIKYDAAILPLWATSVGYDLNDFATAVTVDASGDIYLTGYFQSYHIYFDAFLLPNTATSGGSSDLFLSKMNSPSVKISEINKQQSVFVIYPNPFTFQTTIYFTAEQNNTTIKITDPLGKEIKIINFSGRQLTIEKGEMDAGIYFLQTTDEKKNIASKKIIIQ